MVRYFANALDYILNFPGYVFMQVIVLGSMYLTILEPGMRAHGLAMGFVMHAYALNLMQDHWDHKRQDLVEPLQNYHGVLLFLCVLGAISAFVLYLAGLSQYIPIFTGLYLLGMFIPKTGEVFAFAIYSVLAVFFKGVRSRKDQIQQYVDETKSKSDDT